MAEKQLFTSESVTEGHPDKVADAISDTVVDAILDADAGGRVACETLVTTGMALLAGEITTQVYVDIPKLVRKTIRDTEVPDSDDTDLVREAKDKLDARVEYVADKVGVTGEGGDLTEKLEEDVLLEPRQATMVRLHALKRELIAARRSVCTMCFNSSMKASMSSNRR